MNDSMSILLATTILALGGLGLYMYKTSEDEHKEQKGGDKEDYNEDSIFGSSFWGSNQEDLEEDLNLEEDEEDYKPRRRGGKTQKNRKTTGSSRRRY